MSVIFFFNDTATTEIYTLSLHDALPIWRRVLDERRVEALEHVRVGLEREEDELPELPVDLLGPGALELLGHAVEGQDRKSTRLNSSHANISYAVFCLKKKKTLIQTIPSS